MASSDATLTLVLKARDLATAAIGKVGGAVDTMANTAAAAGGRVAGAFSGLGDKLANGIGNAVETLSSGGSITQAAAGLGIYMAGQVAENFAGTALERFAESGLVAAITAPLAALGTAMGGLISAAIPIGMAALPFLIIGAIVAVIAVLIANPDIRNRVIAFAQQFVGTLVDALGKFLGVLPQVIGDAFGAAWKFVVDGVLPFILQIVQLWFTLPQKLVGLGIEIVKTIIDGMVSLPGKIADVIRSAFSGLKIDIGPFHISASGVKIDLPDIPVPHFAAGGTMVSPGLAVVGERRAELVHLPRGARVDPDLSGLGGGGDGVRIVGVSRAELQRMIDDGLYLQLQNAGTGRLG